MSITAPELRRILQQTRVEDLPDLTETLTRDLVCAGDAAAAMSVAEVAELVGVSAHTLRYYERIGLVEVERDVSGYRSYDRAAVGRVIFITRLRLSDMPVRDIAHYIELVGQGAETVPARLALLEKHRAQIRHQISALQLSLAVIDYKITTYGGRCRG
jgi:DNA-binding transcriptional MerR regulator